MVQEGPLRDAVPDGMDCATYRQGLIQPRQVDENPLQAAFVDIRRSGDREARHIAGALDIDWRTHEAYRPQC
jgi:hypothetical protein